MGREPEGEGAGQEVKEDSGLPRVLRKSTVKLEREVTGSEDHPDPWSGRVGKLGT